MRSCRRFFLLVTLLLLVAPAVGFSCELASTLCGSEGSPTTGVKAPPCHGLPNAAMDCCSVQAPAEPPPAAALDEARLQPAGSCTAPVVAVAQRLPSTAGVHAEPAIERSSDLGRHALLSVYLL